MIDKLSYQTTSPATSQAWDDILRRLIQSKKKQIHRTHVCMKDHVSKAKPACPAISTLQQLPQFNQPKPFFAAAAKGSTSALLS
jgi:hypothetical protein